MRSRFHCRKALVAAALCLILLVLAGWVQAPGSASNVHVNAPLATNPIDAARRVDWTTAGVTGGIPTTRTRCTTGTGTSAIAAYSGTAATINTALSGCDANHYVELASGTFTLSTGIDFASKSNIGLKGAGPDATKIVFTGGTGCAGFGRADVCVISSDHGDGGDGNYTNQATWSAGFTIGTSSITFSAVTKGSIANISAGSLIFLDQLDDTTDTGQVYYCQLSGTCSLEGGSLNGRASRGQQQPSIVTSVSGSGPWTIGISPALRLPNIGSKTPQAWWNSGTPIQGVGIEDLSMDHTASTAASGIFMLDGYNNWVKNIRDLSTSSSGIHKHVWLYQSTHVTIRDSYFYGGGDGGNESYGIDSFNGADNLVENNIFQHMANPVMNEGCVGCVQGYNYALDDYYDAGGSAPEWQQGSSYHHSIGDAFAFWEGNIGIGLTGDNVHGTSNFTTAFRNYWNGRDPNGGGTKTLQTNAIIINAFNRYYNLVGNVLGTSSYHTKYTTQTPTSTNCNVSIYALGWGGNCGTGGTPDDTLVASTLLRWCNWDTFTSSADTSTNDQTGTICSSSEVPSSEGFFPNTVPSSQILPNSMYLSAKPAFMGSSDTWPGIGKDVASGDITGVGGHAFKNPALRCYESLSNDTAYSVDVSGFRPKHFTCTFPM
jgi:hypothetical protein